ATPPLFPYTTLFRSQENYAEWFASRVRALSSHLGLNATGPQSLGNSPGRGIVSTIPHAELSTHLCLGHDTRRYESARAHAVDGSCRYPNYAPVCASHPARRLPAVCARGGAAPPSPSGDRLMNRVRR